MMCTSNYSCNISTVFCVLFYNHSVWAHSMPFQLAEVCSMLASSPITSLESTELGRVWSFWIAPPPPPPHMYSLICDTSSVLSKSSWSWRYIFYGSSTETKKCYLVLNSLVLSYQKTTHFSMSIIMSSDAVTGEDAIAVLWMCLLVQ